MSSSTPLLLLVSIVLCNAVAAVPHTRHRRQSNSNIKDGLPYEGWSGGMDNPSGSIPGAYYGTGINPNYGGNRPNQNTPEQGINVVSYNNDYGQNSGSYSYLNPQQQQYYPYNNNNNNNNNNNAWQRPDTNNYNNQPSNRYPPGSQGWYATGGNYWYNKGHSLIPHAWLLMTAILIPISFV